MYDVLGLLYVGQASPDDVMNVMVSLQWFNLLAKSNLAVYDSVYTISCNCLTRIALERCLGMP